MDYIKTAKKIYAVVGKEVYMKCHQGDIEIDKWVPVNKVKFVAESDNLFDLIEGLYVDVENERFDYGRIYTTGNYDLFRSQILRLTKRGISCIGYRFIKSAAGLTWVAKYDIEKDGLNLL